MSQTARVTNDSGDITLDTFGFNQYVLAEGTLSSTDRDMHSGLRGSINQWPYGGEYGGVMQWWPEVYELTGSINNYSSAIHNAQTPGGNRNGLNTWNIFGRTQDIHLHYGIGSVQHGSMVSPVRFPSSVADAQNLNMEVLATQTPQYPINAGNELYKWAPESYLRNKEAPGNPSSSILYDETAKVFPDGFSGLPKHYLKNTTAQFHTRRTLSSPQTIYGTSWPNIGTPLGYENVTGQAGLAVACDLSITVNDSTGHTVTAITVSGSNVISSFTGAIEWAEATTNGGSPTGRKLQQFWVSGTCIRHVYTTTTSGWTVGSLDSQTYVNGDIENPAALYYNSRFYVTPDRLGYMTGTSRAGFPGMPRMSYRLVTQSINSGSHGIYMADPSSGLGSNTTFIWDCLYSYTAERFKAPQDARFFFKVNDGEYLSLGCGQYLSSTSISNGTGNLEGDTRIYYQGVHSTQTSVDYFVAGSISEEQLNSDTYGLDTRNEEGELTFTTRTNSSLVDLLGFEENSGTIGATTDNVIANVPTDAYISIPMYPSPALAYPGAAGWSSNAVSGYQYCPWIYRSGTNIYIRWYAQNRVQSDVPSNVSAANFPGIARSSVPVMWGKKL